MAQIGMQPEDIPEDIVDIWPENERAFSLFSSISTQWRVSMNGPIGLDYNVLYKKLDRMNLSADEYDELEASIQIMESEALRVMGKKAEEAANAKK